ncbi:MAG: TetR/AcrR family transcriptional regulator, partial [Cyanobacteria bacterium]|nr:TetR/AcrR family transcriptional regulator [Cyanobacteriota bacterium]
MGRREEKREATRQDILNAAFSLFMECGYDATSVDTITEKANVAKGTFYYHFKSKEEVMMGLGLRYTRQLQESVEKRINDGESP